MAAKLGGADDDIIADINVTPLVDIVLVVLIIFMVTAVDIVKASIPVSLPEAASGEDITESASLGLSLTADGKLLLDGEEVTGDQLRARIQSEAAAGREITCLIAADADVPHKRVIWLIDLVKLQGVTKFAFNIDPVAVEAGAEMGD